VILTHLCITLKIETRRTPTDQVTGSIDTSPFALEGCSLEYITSENRGRRTIHLTPICTSIIVYIFKHIKQRNAMIGNGISIRHANPYYQYKYNFCVVFELITTTNPDSFVVPEKGQGKVDLRLKNNDKSIGRALG
jgi:hypothetical protein